MIVQRGWCQHSVPATLQCADKTREADLCIESAVSIEQTHGGLALSILGSIMVSPDSHHFFSWFYAQRQLYVTSAGVWLWDQTESVTTLTRHVPA